MEGQARPAQHPLEAAHQVMMADQAKLAAFPKSDSDFVTNHAEARPWQTEGRIPTGPNPGSGGQDAFRRPSAFELRFTLETRAAGTLSSQPLGGCAEFVPANSYSRRAPSPSARLPGRSGQTRGWRRSE